MAKLPYPHYKRLPENHDMKFELTEDYSLELDIELPDYSLNKRVNSTVQIANLKGNNLTILVGYQWDGCSGPARDPKKSRTPCLVHDVLCQMLNNGQMAKGLDPFTKAHSNRIHKMFYRHLRRNRMLFLRARLWFRAVMFAWASYN